ncbi:MarR family winged helix-turn-helix transcriptional regulator [Umezawaea endophytica]|uniref:MarR family transcriptional regulator n=1 Tax=Umezawaea endophytica TaxID=1654476 RepID=A0A9X2VW70_9PSEU|nr:MarR family transcriptional regulator [Umezawaea endophytica]MCS7483799.1 MarR family transcriptional regulator [Umezawaea endophytica]
MSPDQERRAEMIGLLRAFGAADSALGRQFAKQQRMHPTDAAAVVAILDAERGGGSITPARLAERIGLSANATSAVLNRLEEAGHVVRSREHRDRRLVSLHTTPRVHADAEVFFSSIGSALDAALTACPVEQTESLTRLLRELVDVMTAGLDESEGSTSHPPGPAATR